MFARYYADAEGVDKFPNRDAQSGVYGGCFGKNQQKKYFSVFWNCREAGAGVV